MVSVRSRCLLLSLCLVSCLPNRGRRADADTPTDAVFDTNTNDANTNEDSVADVLVEDRVDVVSESMVEIATDVASDLVNEPARDADVEDVDVMDVRPDVAPDIAPPEAGGPLALMVRSSLCVPANAQRSISVRLSAPAMTAVSISVTGLPSGTTAPLVAIPIGEQSATITLQLGASVPSMFSLLLLASQGSNQEMRTITVRTTACPGTLDPTFGGVAMIAPGIAPLMIPSPATRALINDVVVRSDGRIVVGGAVWDSGDDWAANRTTDWMLWGMTENGSVDTAFGSSAGTNFTGSGWSRIDASFRESPMFNSDVINSIAVPATTGAIWIAGMARPMTTSDGEPVMGKLNADGTRSADFGTNGVLFFSQPAGVGNDTLNAVVAHDNIAEVYGQTEIPRPTQSRTVSGARVNAMGMPLPYGGRSSLNGLPGVPMFGSVFGARRFPDGTTMIVGEQTQGYDDGSPSRGLAIRYDQEGALQTPIGRTLSLLSASPLQFTTDGSLPITGYLRLFAVDRTAGGNFAVVGSYSAAPTPGRRGLLAVLSPAGTIVPFRQTQVRSLSCTTDSVLSDVVVRSDGVIFAVGTCGLGTSLSRSVVYAYQEDGTPLPDFGNESEGVFVLDLGVPSEARAVALDSMGRIIVAGWRSVSGLPVGFVLRLLP